MFEDIGIFEATSRNVKNVKNFLINSTKVTPDEKWEFVPLYVTGTGDSWNAVLHYTNNKNPKANFDFEFKAMIVNVHDGLQGTMVKMIECLKNARTKEQAHACTYRPKPGQDSRPPEAKVSVAAPAMTARERRVDRHQKKRSKF